MAAKIISGKEISAKLRGEIADEALTLAKNGRKPCLAVIIVGNAPASRVYVNNKKKGCEACNITSLEYALDEATDETTLLELIERLNSDSTVDGILCQLPLPGHIDENKILDAISPDKDVDGFHPVNVGRLLEGKKGFVPCTPNGIMEMLRYSGINPAGMNCAVIGRSNIVGKPIALLMLAQNATVTVCHSRTKNLADITSKADIIVAAVGKPKFVTADMVKDGAVIIDVGINRLPDGKLCGDVDFDNVVQKAGAITPVPGGVGPMTITMLLKNTVEAYKNYLNS